MPICPYCNSAFTTEKGIAANTKVMAREYRCDNCGKYFQVETDAKSASGTWLMTVWRYSPISEVDEKTFISIYKTPEGRIQINQSYKKTTGEVTYHSGEITPKFYVKNVNNQYCLQISTKNDRFDSIGITMNVDVLDMNQELSRKAWSNTEMRTLHRGYDEQNRFKYFFSKNKALMEARCRFLQSLIDEQTDPDACSGGSSKDTQEPVETVGFVQALSCLYEGVPNWLGGAVSVLLGVIPLVVFLMLAPYIKLNDNSEIPFILFVTVVVTVAVEVAIMYALGSIKYKYKKKKRKK